MAQLYAVAGAKISIGGVIADQSEDFDETDFSGEAWTEIDGWTQMGAIGDSAQEITTSVINRGRDIKQKGTRNAGTMENVFAVVPGDAGQAALIAAEKTPDNYAFKIEFDDAPAGGTPTTKYFIALVMSSSNAGGDANTVRTLNATLSINSNVVTVDAAEA